MHPPPLPASSDDLAQRILDALPQTQCTRCGYPDCTSYARAVASGSAEINRCPPGGAEGVQRLAELTARPPLPLDPACGAEGPRGVAWIDEDWCIGCTLCIKACPVDCIVGSNKFMHTVIESECTGCELCVAACPVDCIHMQNITGKHTGWDAWSHELATAARQRYRATQERRATTARRQRQTAAEPHAVPRSGTPRDGADKRAAVAAALERARRHRASFGT